MPVDKSGRFYVVGSVPLLHPESQTVAEMLEGWCSQQLCRNLAHDTIEARIRLVGQFLAYTNEFPSTWTPSMVEEFFSDLRSIKRCKQSTGAVNRQPRCDKMPSPGACRRTLAAATDFTPWAPPQPSR